MADPTKNWGSALFFQAPQSPALKTASFFFWHHWEGGSLCLFIWILEDVYDAFLVGLPARRDSPW